MPLTKTTEVPAGDPALILAEAIIKMVVLGNRPSVAQTADNLAQAPPIVDRKVIWFKDGLPANYQLLFNVQDLPNVQAFSLSIANVVGDRILSAEVVDNVRMEMAYTAAAI